MLQNLNPYALDYSRDQPISLQDPDQAFRGLSRCPYSPSLLLCYAPLAILPWPLARVLSMMLEWAAIIILIAVLSRTLSSQVHRLVFVISALAGFVGSYQWRLHIERGQYHIFVTLLLALGVFMLTKRRRDLWIAGIPFGLAASFRPTIAILFIVLFLVRAHRAVLTAIGTALLMVLLTMPFGGVQQWQDWRILVHRYENLVAGQPDPALRYTGR